MVSMMNVGHKAMANWSFQFLEIPENGNILDCGCGGEANMERILREYPKTTAWGIDYSEVSVEKSRKVNGKALAEGRCKVLRASVMELPFETVYFWPDLLKSFQEIYRVTKSGGVFFICNECNGDTDKDDKWTEKIPGMKIYKDFQLKDFLEQAGFSNVRIQKNEKGWISITAGKGAI